MESDQPLEGCSVNYNVIDPTEFASKMFQSTRDSQTPSGGQFSECDQLDSKLFAEVDPVMQLLESSNVDSFSDNITDIVVSADIQRLLAPTHPDLDTSQMAPVSYTHLTLPTKRIV